MTSGGPTDFSAWFSAFDLFKETFFFKIYLFILERERQYEWEGQRERERESQADSGLSVEPDAGLDPTTLKS